MSKFKDKLYIQYFRRVKLRQIQRAHRRRVKRIQLSCPINVVFIISNLPMWKSQDLYDLLTEDPRFCPKIVLCPYSVYTASEKIKNIQILKDFFGGRDIPYTDVSCIENPKEFIINKLSPEIIFYPQQYFNLYGNGIDSEYFDDYLTCFIPYGLNVFNQPWAFNQRLSNTAWRLYYSTPDDLVMGQSYSLNKGRNIRIVGSPLSKQFLECPRVTDESPTIIWAPHYSINGGYLHRGSFLYLYDVMVQMARQYERVKFVFKPHPKLLSELYLHPEWGKERTDSYYSLWNSMSNTHLELGNYVNLFMSSNAMIHDCGSFTAEYLYSRNPVLFITKDKNKTLEELSQFGKEAIHAHYFGETTNDIKHFIEDIVLNGNDPLKEKREKFFNDYLLPPNGKSTAQNIYEDLVKSLKLDK